MRALRASGCICRPAFVADRANVPGTRESGTVVHQPSCPLWQLLSSDGAVLVVEGVTGCAR